MNAGLVYDGSGFLPTIPKSMGNPLEDQCQGKPLEVLGELASRICYDSLGTDEHGKRRGRSSEKLHAHILEVKNHSVYEHCVFTVVIAMSALESEIATYACCLNRKGLWLERTEHAIEITVNFRTVLEWDRHSGHLQRQWRMNRTLGKLLWMYGQDLAPMVFANRELDGEANRLYEYSRVKGTQFLNEDQAHITLWLYGSRGFTHEQVRHRFAMSQRSTRYVDEDGSDYVMHPLVEKFLNDDRVPEVNRGLVHDQILRSVSADRKTYRDLVEALQEYCVEQLDMVDKTAARKQARGAARGYLGNALASEMLFTAPVSGWKWILRNRKNKLADAEIREVYTPALEALKRSQYGLAFTEFETKPSPDGLGTVLV